MSAASALQRLPDQGVQVPLALVTRHLVQDELSACVDLQSPVVEKWFQSSRQRENCLSAMFKDTVAWSRPGKRQRKQFVVLGHYPEALSSMARLVGCSSQRSAQLSLGRLCKFKHLCLQFVSSNRRISDIPFYSLKSLFQRLRVAHTPDWHHAPSAFRFDPIQRIRQVRDRRIESPVQRGVQSSG